MNKILSKNTHLSEQETIKRGGFYTPDIIVNLCYQMSKRFISPDTIIMDLGAGYGAFLSVFGQSQNKNIIATDNDNKAIDFLRKNYPNISVRKENSLINVTRSKYLLKENDKIIIIGNPPYNDVTSQYKKGDKGGFTIDSDIYSRDLGISFLKMFNKLKPDCICVLHPLSYLVKKGNYKSAQDFFSNYKLIDACIFSSRLFENIKSNSLEFPVVAACYLKEKSGTSLDYLNNFQFKILNEKDKFQLSKYKTIDGIINKYPSKDKKDCDLQFYTIRDLNALFRNKTFLTGHCNNGILVTKENLYLYAWLDFLKNNFPKSSITYIFGNLSPLMPTSLLNNELIKHKLNEYIIQTNRTVAEYFKKNDINFYNNNTKTTFDNNSLNKILNDELEKIFK